ncbi:aromatic amino acid ammonia-lyase [Paenibacillus radicis (ex Gao et al. 2016)]|uniref:Histidine ammonia-lyase n=1 Tax=Paenibacillus radicis (ex Gao et al. 2016) TaxID=1737354 RepID=A0A917H4J2_9BACL|nr:aromatic amino acid ammonia-lyase [Paenibacillus radicis (ex Gao et al. 2016)]GGG67342.1 histidine ammonia-lyase [Paenibacillus radicis (ex Gao et al. 2016)]
MKDTDFYIDGYSLTVEHIIKAGRGELGEVGLNAEARSRCQSSRSQIANWLGADAPVVYGVNTGLGNLKDTVLSPEEHLAWNKTIPYPHAVGVGQYLNPAITRASLLIRANVLSRGYSGVRPELIDRMLTIFNHGIAPAIRELGSTGLSDLGPLAHNAMVVSGLEDAEVFYKGNQLRAQACFEALGLEAEFPLECKEALAQMNGSTMTQAIAIFACHNMLQLLDIEQQIEGLLSREREIRIDSKDQINRAVERAFGLILNTVNFENNITCDNPLLFVVEDGYEAVMGCNCSNTQVGYTMDLLTILIADKANYVMEFINRLDEAEGGKLRAIREAASAAVGLVQTLSLPASADSIPTKANQEDHVEFSYGAARKAMKALGAYQSLLSYLFSAVIKIEAAHENDSKLKEVFPDLNVNRTAPSARLAAGLNHYLGEKFDLVPLTYS